MKKSKATKKAKGSSSSSFNAKRFVSVEVEAHFHNSVKRRLGLRSEGLKSIPLIWSTLRPSSREGVGKSSVSHIRQRR